MLQKFLARSLNSHRKRQTLRLKICAENCLELTPLTFFSIIINLLDFELEAATRDTL